MNRVGMWSAFALFLLGIKGDMDVDAAAESYSLKVARMSPGAFAFACATLLIAVSVLNRPQFGFKLLSPDSPNRAIDSTPKPAQKTPTNPGSDTNVQPPVQVQDDVHKNA